jgi:hypothetical protein
MRRHKYNAVRTIVDGKNFPSKAEAQRYGTLKLMLAAGEIVNLRTQVSFKLVGTSEYYPLGMEVCRYKADFVYENKEGTETIVEDVKGYLISAEFRLKRKLMKLYHGITVRVVDGQGREKHMGDRTE